MNQYFGQAPNAFQGGMEFSAAQRERKLRENALNAMVQRFGPEAADPVMLGQLEGIQQRRELHPYAMQEAGRQDAARSALVNELGPTAGDPAALAMQQQGRQRAALNAATYLQSTRDRGGDLGAAYDRISSLLPAFGVPAAQLGGVREQIVSSPEAVGDLVAMLRSGDPTTAVRTVGQPVPVTLPNGRHALMQVMTDGSHQIIRDEQGSPLSPSSTLLAEARLEQGWSRLSWDQTKQFLPNPQPGVQYWMAPDGRVVADVTPGSPQETARQDSYAAQESTLRGQISGLGNIVRASGTVIREADRILALMGPSFDGTPAAARLAAARVPGDNNPFYRTDQLIESLKANVGIDALLNIKREGAGLGNVPQTQLNTLQSLLGNLHVGRPAGELREDILHIQDLYSQIVRTGEADLERLEQQLQTTRSGPSSYGPQSSPTAPQTPPAAPQPQAEPSIDDLLRMYGGAQ